MCAPRRHHSIVVHEGKVLVIHHRKLDRWLPLGGHIELDEDPEQAALREAQEELDWYISARANALQVAKKLRKDFENDQKSAENLLDDIRKAHELSETRHVRGKIVIQVR